MVEVRPLAKAFRLFSFWWWSMILSIFDHKWRILSTHSLRINSSYCYFTTFGTCLCWRKLRNPTFLGRFCYTIQNFGPFVTSPESKHCQKRFLLYQDPIAVTIGGSVIYMKLHFRLHLTESYVRDDG